tara:strand:+ start:99 stop:476 length:378 start_codon:yes stop_codon:yes gene_type:complete
MKNKLLIIFIFSSVFASQDSLVVRNDPDMALKLNIIPFFGYIPSLGQLENKKPLKALTLMTMKSYWLEEYRNSKRTEDISDRNRSLWWMIALILYGAIDAHVDSHLENFPKDEVLDSLVNKNTNK